MEVNKPDNHSVEYGFLSDRIGHAGVNFNGVQHEDISISVFYATIASDGEDKSIENMRIFRLSRNSHIVISCF